MSVPSKRLFYRLLLLQRQIRSFQTTAARQDRQPFQYIAGDFKAPQYKKLHADYRLQALEPGYIHDEYGCRQFVSAMSGIVILILIWNLTTFRRIRNDIASRDFIATEKNRMANLG